MCFHSNTRRARCSCVKVLERVKNERKSGFDPLPHITILPTTGITIKKGWASTLWHIHLPTILLCTRVIRSTNTCTPASTMSAPVTSGQIVSALSMPSAKWLVASGFLSCCCKASWEMESQTIHSMVWPTSCHSPPTHLPPYATKEVPPASSEMVMPFCSWWVRSPQTRTYTGFPGS